MELARQNQWRSEDDQHSGAEHGRDADKHRTGRGNEVRQTGAETDQQEHQGIDQKAKVFPQVVQQAPRALGHADLATVAAVDQAGRHAGQRTRRIQGLSQEVAPIGEGGRQGHLDQVIVDGGRQARQQKPHDAADCHAADNLAREERDGARHVRAA